MYPHVRDTLYDLIREIHLPTPSSPTKAHHRRRYLLYHAYYVFYVLAAIRLLFSSFAIRYDMLWYFEYDSTMATLKRIGSSNANFLLVFGVTTTFPIYSHKLVYYEPDPIIWERMYDVLVRNVDQFKEDNGWLLFKFSLIDLLYPLAFTGKLWRMVFSRITGRNVRISRKLIYFPHASERVRCQVLLISLYFEFLARFLYLITLGDFLYRSAGLYQTIAIHHNVGLFLLHCIDCFTFWFFFLIFGQVGLYNLNIIAQTSLIACSEYRYLNRLLQTAVNMMRQKATLRILQALIFKMFHEYKVQHTRLTLFILRTGDFILSPILFNFLFCCLATSSYMILVLLFQSVDMYYANALLSLVLFQVLGSITAMGSFIPVNYLILSSAPILFSVINLMNRTFEGPSAVGSAYRRRCRWQRVQSLEKVTDKWSVQTYYEQLTNDRGCRQLLLSAGMYGTICRKTIIQLFAVYFAYFMTFTVAYRNERLQVEY